MSDLQPILLFLGPSGSDNTIYLSGPTGRQPIFNVRIDASSKPQVQLSRILPAPQAGQILTQPIGTATTSSMSDTLKLVVHGQEITIPNFSYGTDPFSQPFGISQMPSGRLKWVVTTRGGELWDERKTVKIARCMPHDMSGGEPEIMMYVPSEDKFVDMFVLIALALMVASKQSLKVGGKVLNALLGM